MHCVVFALFHVSLDGNTLSVLLRDMLVCGVVMRGVVVRGVVVRGLVVRGLVVRGVVVRGVVEPVVMVVPGLRCVVVFGGGSWCGGA